MSSTPMYYTEGRNKNHMVVKIIKVQALGGIFYVRGVNLACAAAGRVTIPAVKKPKCTT